MMIEDKTINKTSVGFGIKSDKVKFNQASGTGGGCCCSGGTADIVVTE